MIITSVLCGLVEGLFFLSTQKSRTVLRQAQHERVFFGGCARYGGVGCGAGSGVGAPAGGRSPRGRRRSIAVPLTSVRITACPSCTQTLVMSPTGIAQMSGRLEEHTSEVLSIMSIQYAY